jgi:hypothetical protein
MYMEKDAGIAVVGPASVEFPENLIDVFIEFPCDLFVESLVLRFELKQQITCEFKKRFHANAGSLRFVDTSGVDQTE